MASNIDGGYAWIILIASFVGHFLQYGVVWTVGVFYVIFLENLDHNGSGQVALISSLNTAVYYVTGPIAGMMTNKYGCRKVAVVGGVISSIGFVLSTFAENVYHLYFTFGILTGFGLGLAYIPTISSVGFYFEKYRSMALGVAASGVGLGTFAFPPLIRVLVDTYGWRGALLIIGSICLNVSLTGALLRPIEVHNEENKLKVTEEKLTNMQVFKNNGYVILCVHTMLISFGLSVVYVHLAAYACSVGFTENEGAILFSVLGVCNFMGRLVFGALNQHPSLSPFCLYFWGFFGAGLYTVLCPFATHLYGLHIYSGIFGLFTACFGTILPQIIVEMLGIDLLTSGYGYVLVFMATGTLSGGPVAGWLYDATSCYPVSFFVGGSFMIVASLLLIIPWKCQEKQCSIYHSTRNDSVKYDIIMKKENGNVIIERDHIDVIKTNCAPPV